MSRDRIYMKLYWGDYLKDTSHLTARQHGVYLLLMGHYFSTGKPLPSDLKKIARIARLSDIEADEDLPVVLEFFKLEQDGRYHHKRVDEELANAAQQAKKRRERAQKGAAARWGKDQHPGEMLEACLEHPGEMLEGCQSCSYSRSKESPEAKRKSEAVASDAPRKSPRHGKKSHEASAYWKDALDLSNHLASLILRNTPDHSIAEIREREIAVTRWAGDIEKLIRLNGRKPDHVREVIQFCQDDSFWRKNILSGSKFREKYDQLLVAMTNGKGGKGGDNLTDFNLASKQAVLGGAN